MTLTETEIDRCLSSTRTNKTTSLYLQAIRVPSSKCTRQAALLYRLPAHPSQVLHGSQSTPICLTCGNVFTTGVKYRDSYSVQSDIESADTELVGPNRVTRSSANSTRSSHPRPEHEYRPTSDKLKFWMTSEWSAVIYTLFESTGSAMPRATSFRPASTFSPDRNLHSPVGETRSYKTILFGKDVYNDKKTRVTRYKNIQHKETYMGTISKGPIKNLLVSKYIFRTPRQRVVETKN